jgi:hypothetical protein
MSWASVSDHINFSVSDSWGLTADDDPGVGPARELSLEDQTFVLAYLAQMYAASPEARELWSVGRQTGTRSRSTRRRRRGDGRLLRAASDAESLASIFRPWLTNSVSMIKACLIRRQRARDRQLPARGLSHGPAIDRATDAWAATARSVDPRASRA